jgi:predicted nucleic acid-binding protein
VRRAERIFLEFLRTVPLLPLNRSIMRRFARLRGELRQRGQLIGDPDLLIAATAIEHKCQLVTRNLRHFSRISELELYQPES